MSVKEAEREITIDDLKRVDIGKLRVEIQEMEGKLELDTRAALEEIGKRKSFLKVVDIIQNGKPPRKKREVKPKAPATPERTHVATTNADGPKRGRPSAADRIFQAIMTRGPMVKSEIIRDTGLSDDSAAFALQNDERFFMLAGGKWDVRV